MYDTARFQVTVTGMKELTDTPEFKAAIKEAIEKTLGDLATSDRYFGMVDDWAVYPEGN